MEIDHRFAPIGRDAHAILRQKSLLGETYVEITPGSPGGPKLADGGTLAARERRRHGRARRGLPRVRPGDARGLPAVAPRGRHRHHRQLRARLQRLARERRAVLQGGADLLRPLAEQEVALRRVFRDTGRVFHAVSREDGQLRGLITDGDATFGALASRDDALAETFQIFPTFLRETRATVRRLEALRPEHRPARARPALSRRATSRPTLRDLGDLSPDLEKLFNAHPSARARVEDGRAGRHALPEGRRAGARGHARVHAGAEPDPVLPQLRARSARPVHHRRRRGAGRQRRGRLHGQRRGGALPAAGRDHRRPLAPAPPGPAGLGAGELVHRAERLRPRDAARRDRELRLQADRRREAQPVGLRRGGRAALLRGAAAPLGQPEVPAPAARQGAVRARPEGPRGHRSQLLHKGFPRPLSGGTGRLMFERFKRNSIRRATTSDGYHVATDTDGARRRTRDDASRHRRPIAAVSIRPPTAARPARPRRETMRDVRARQRDEYGGLNWGAAFFGWLVAVGMAAILLGHPERGRHGLRAQRRQRLRGEGERRHDRDRRRHPADRRARDRLLLRRLRERAHVALRRRPPGPRHAGPSA